ncbi:MAG: hypothetical protein AABO57_26450 [Acidobacteriota bacterium]
MPKKVAPPKPTSGGGFVFEDDVVAYFFSCLLGGQPPLSPDLGLLARLDFQARADGWLLDDILLTLTPHGVTRRCPFSVKSNRQFTSQSAPREFVVTAWEQLLHAGTAVFDVECDWLGIITAPLPTPLSDSIQHLVGAASKQDSKLLAHRASVPGFMSKMEAKLFSSFECPVEFKEKYPEDCTNTGELLKRLIHLEFDFERQPSTRHQDAVRNCRDVLKSNSLDEAILLWEELRRIGQGHRTRAGFIDFKGIVDLVRYKFRLKNFPEHQVDWERLSELTQINLTVIPDKIGNIVSISRSADRYRLSEQLARRKAVVIRGPSGCGKTVLTKLWAEEAGSQAKVLWWEAKSFETSDFTNFETHLGLRNPLRDVLRCTTDSDASLVIDGIDRVFSEQAFRNFAVLLQYVEAGLETSPWRLLLTVQPEEWDRIQIQLAAVNVSTSGWQILDLSEPPELDLAPVWKAFPSLGQLRLQRHLKGLLLKPKVLDLLATHLHIAPLDTSKWVGESNLIKWFWETEVLNKPDGATRAGFLKLLAEKQGDDLRAQTSSGTFPIADQTSVSGLVRDRICRMRDEQLSFDHDLYGDWARQRILLSYADSLSEYLSHRMTSPLWHRALRLYSLHLLELEPNLTRWRNLLNSFASDDGKGTLEQDLILESTIFAANPESILERLWADLANDSGVLLRRLLRRFHHTATLANPMVLVVSKMIDDYSDTDAALTNRIPYWPYWLPMLRFLHNHLGQVIDMAIKPVSDLVNTWLRLGAENWPLRVEAAEIALAAGEHINRFKRQDGIVIVEDKIDEAIYRAVLAGATDLTERVTNFALEASCRVRARVEEDDEWRSDSNALGIPDPTPHFGATRKTDAWPDGPTDRVDRAFHNVCLESDSLLPLINANPDAAREVILANLIEEPEEYYEHNRHPQSFNLDGFQYLPGWHPPFYTRGPFLQFLRAQPKEGLETILRLVNFATERWSQERNTERYSAPFVVVPLPEGVQEWAGDGHVYYWYRDSGRCPHSVVSALMALERWFYEETEKKKNLVPFVETIIRCSKSVAFAGLLSAVGRNEPSLFSGILQPLFAIPEFHVWEFQYGAQQADYYSMISWTFQSSFLVKAASEWHSMPHRQTTLHDWARWFYLNASETRPFFDQARTNWLERLRNSTRQDWLAHHLEWLIPRFEIGNYKIEERSDARTEWIYEAPKEFQDKHRDESEKAARQLQLMEFPVRCKAILEGGKPLPADSIEDFWNEIQRISKLFRGDSPDESVRRIDDAVCGGIAVLLEYHSDWLKRYPDHKEFCTQRLIESTRNPPPSREFDSDVSAYDWAWHSFCARAVPILWSENPDEPIVRESVVSLALNSHYKTVATLCQSAAKRRVLLGDHFSQLQNFLVFWSSVRWEIGRYRHPEQPEFDEAEWLERETQSFIKGTTKILLRGWSHSFLQQEEEAKHRRSGRRKRYRQFPKIDLAIIQSIFSWLPALSEAHNETERSEWVALWKEMLDVFLWTMSSGVEDENEIDGTPHEWDRWVLGRVAWIVQQLNEDEHPEDFWRPILSLGSPGHYWVEHFLTDWFSVALRAGPMPDQGLIQWKAMIDFALYSPDWDLASPRPNYYISEIWCHLMGFDHIVRSLWNEDQRGTVDALEPDYCRWASVFLLVPRCLTGFSVFLMSSAADGILLEALRWIEASIVNASRDFFNERDVQECLVQLLDHSWHTHNTALRQQPDTFKAFMSVLKKMADLQNPTALEIQQRVVSTV